MIISLWWEQTVFSSLPTIAALRGKKACLGAHYIHTVASTLPTDASRRLHLHKLLPIPFILSI